MCGEKIVELCLSYIFVKVLNENVSFLIEILQQWYEPYSATLNGDIIHLLKASVCFLLCVEA